MYELDTRRLLCPMPVIRTQDRVAQLSHGEQLAVFCTDPGVIEDIPTWCRINGHEVLDITEDEQEIIVTIRVNAPP